MVYWYWLVFGIVLIALEAMLPSFVAFWFGAGAIVTGLVLMAVPMSFAAQLLVWLGFAGAALTAWFKWIRPRMRDRTTSGLARESIVGEIGMVIRLPHEHRRGMLKFSIPKLGAEEWEFICDAQIEIGDRVHVREISGNTLIVDKR
jgi:membrane protein implicated in regulation of membrane protease activity